MTKKGVKRIRLSAPEAAIFDIFYSNASSVDVGDREVIRFGMVNGQLQQFIRDIATRFFDNDTNEARTAIANTAEKLEHYGCVQRISQRPDREPPGVLQMLLLRNKIQITIVNSDQPTSNAEEDMTPQAVATFLESKLREMQRTTDDTVRKLEEALAAELKVIGEKMANRERIDQTRYNDIRDQLETAKSSMPDPLAFALSDVIVWLNAQTTPVSAAVESPPPAEIQRLRKSSKWFAALKVLATNPQFENEFISREVIPVLQQAGMPHTQPEVSDYLFRGKKRGYLEARAMSTTETKRYKQQQQQGSRAWLVFKFTNTGRQVLRN